MINKIIMIELSIVNPNLQRFRIIDLAIRFKDKMVLKLLKVNWRIDQTYNNFLFGQHIEIIISVFQMIFTVRYV